MMTISVIVGSTRQGRFSEKPARWILQEVRKKEARSAFHRRMRVRQWVGIEVCNIMARTTR
jgi:NAD(P)H-dependent FMN reductase